MATMDAQRNGSVSSDISDSSTMVDIENTYVKPDKLGRERPDVFKSAWQEVIFIISLLVSLSMADFIISGFQALLPALIDPLDIPAVSQTWPSSVITLVLGSFLIPMGRFTDMYGGYVMYGVGMTWFAIWTLVTGFSRSFPMLVVCRAMQGLGLSAYLPAGMTLLGKAYQPGPRKNLVFGIYGALSPIGFISGTTLGALSQELLSWSWYFYSGSIIASLCLIGVAVFAPRDWEEARKSKVEMDWLGLVTTVPGFMLLVYAITDSSRAPDGWASPQIIGMLIGGVVFLGAAAYVEGWRAKAPLIPSDIFHVKYMKRMLLCLFVTWGIFSVFVFNANFYIQKILDKSPLVNAAWFIPWAVGGIMFAIASGLLLHILPGRMLIVISEATQLITHVLFALLPKNPNYWAMVMPAMICEAACVNILFTVSNVFLTTSLPRGRQGLAGALIYVTLYLGSAFFLAITNVAMVDFKRRDFDIRTQYRDIFWIGAGLSGLALLIGATIGVDKAKAAPVDPSPPEPKVIDDGLFPAKDIFEASEKHDDNQGTMKNHRVSLVAVRPSTRGTSSDSDTVVGSGSDEDIPKKDEGAGLGLESSNFGKGGY